MSAAAKRENVLGPCRCPLCSGAAEVRLSASGFAYIAMDCCKAQLFTRGPKSDELARDMIGAKAQPPATPVAQPPQPPVAPVRTSEPVRTPAAPAPQAPAPVQAPPPAAPQPAGFGLRWF